MTWLAAESKGTAASRVLMLLLQLLLLLLRLRATRVPRVLPPSRAQSGRARGAARAAERAVHGPDGARRGGCSAYRSVQDARRGSSWTRSKMAIAVVTPSEQSWMEDMACDAANHAAAQVDGPPGGRRARASGGARRRDNSPSHARRGGERLRASRGGATLGGATLRCRDARLRLGAVRLGGTVKPSVAFCCADSRVREGQPEGGERPARWPCWRARMANDCAAPETVSGFKSVSLTSASASCTNASASCRGASASCTSASASL
jgi:hypothetical protein